MGGGEAGGSEFEGLESAAEVEGWGGCHYEMVGGLCVVGMSFFLDVEIRVKTTRSLGDA